MAEGTTRGWSGTSPSSPSTGSARVPTRSSPVNAATAHAVAKHGHKNTSELREMIRSGLEDVPSPA